MRINRLFLLIILAIIYPSCNFDSKKFIIEQQVKNYVENVRKIESQNNLLFIFITGYSSGCRPCEDDSMALIDSIFNLKSISNFSKYIVISDKNEDSYKYIRSDAVTVLKDSKYDLQKHGIDFPFNFIIEFDKSFKTIYWEALIPDNFNKIYEIYKNK